MVRQSGDESRSLPPQLQNPSKLEVIDAEGRRGPTLAEGAVADMGGGAENRRGAGGGSVRSFASLGTGHRS